MGYREYLFVYGSLMQDLSNHKMFLSGADKIGSYATCKKYRLVSLGGFPMALKASIRQKENKFKLVKMRSNFRPIRGEVYELSLVELNFIDKLEGHPYWYERELVEIKGLKENNGKAWMYIGKNQKGIYNNNPRVTTNSNREFDWRLDMENKARRCI